MPSALTYPGVYIEEIPSGVRTITGVATSITAFIGRALRGPTNKAVTINSFADFERIFGGLWVESTLGYAVRDFYLNGGSQAIIVRLFHPTFVDNDARQTAFDAAKAEAQTAADAVALAATTAATAGGATVQTVVEAVKKAVGDASTPGAAARLAAEAVGNAAADAAAATGATPAKVAAAASGAVPTAVTGAAGDVAPITKARFSANGLALQAASEGDWGNKLRARIDHDVKGLDAADTANLFNLTLRDGKTGAVELFRSVSVKPGHVRQVDNVLRSESTLAVVESLPGTKPAAHAKDPQADKTIWDDNNPATSTGVPEDAQAENGTWLDDNDFIGGQTEAKKEGLFALENADLFNLLCIPPFLENGNVDGTVIDQAISYCEKRRAVMLVDSPAGWKNKDQAKGGVNSPLVGKVSKNAALFFPRLKQPNPLRDNQVEEFVPCGAVAGIFARTDTTRGVWKAPAGLDATLTGVPELSVSLTDPENGELNPLGINCLRVMPAVGRVVWGSRTREGDDRIASEWKYIPVRRLALYIEESLYRGTQWVVFEPNDEPLWAQIRLNVGAFMNNLFRQGAFQGTTPRDAYFVKCDKETTTQNDINLGVVNIVVGFAPLKPAEFVVIKLQQMAGQIQT